MRSTLAHDGRAIGSCSKCGAGIAYEGQDSGTTATCPNCGAKVRLSFVYGNKSAWPCDGACMGAIGKICACSCGGVNHGRWFLPIELVPVWEQDKAKAAQAKRIRDFADRVARKRQAKEDRERAEREALLSTHPELARLLDEDWFRANGEWSGFMVDMRAAVQRGSMSERMVSATLRTITKIEERNAEREKAAAKKAAVVASGVTVQEGRYRIEGTIVRAVEKEETHGYNQVTVIKITVELANGTKVWGTLSKDHFYAAWDKVQADRKESNPYWEFYDEWFKTLTGRTIKFDARVKRSDRDQTFGFFSRPTKVELSDGPQ